MSPLALLAVAAVAFVFFLGGKKKTVPVQTIGTGNPNANVTPEHIRDIEQINSPTLSAPVPKVANQ